MTPTLYMLIGPPGVGKSTWLKSQGFNPNNRFSGGPVVVSTDNHIEQYASSQGKTYDDVFKGYISKATSKMNQDLDFAVSNSMDIVWDQTNLTAKSRAGKLKKVPDNYHKVAVVFLLADNDELQRRLGNRPNKTIPPHVIDSMLSSFEMPDMTEGFDEVKVVSQ